MSLHLQDRGDVLYFNCWILVNLVIITDIHPQHQDEEWCTLTKNKPAQ